MDEYPNDVAVYFFHNPLGFHPNAMPAAKASMAAWKQGKFWEYHDKLFENQRELSDENYTKWAQELGLDVEKFKTDMADPAIEAEIKRQQTVMVALGARGTPAFFINGEAIKGAQPFENFKQIIDKQLEATNAKVQAGSAASQAWREVSKAAGGENFVAWVAEGQKPEVKEAAPEQPQERAQPPAADATVWKVAVDGNDATRGAEQPLVRVIVFSEFQ